MAKDRRSQIVEAAAHSFASFGYKATTMDQIAKIASVGKGTIYTFFTNKEELFNEIMNSMIISMKNAADEVYDTNRPFFDNLNMVLDRILNFRSKHELAAKLVSEVRDVGTPEAMEAMNQLEGAIVSYIKTKVQSAVDKSEIKPCDPELTAFVMLKMYLSLTLEWEKGREPLTKNDIKRLFELYIMKGLAT